MDIIELLRQAKSLEASDLHMVVASPPMVRVNGSLEPMNGIAQLSSADISDDVIFQS